ncbi:MAG: amino acid ABC transporter permease [Clostridiaceae bacterium]|nr:amino acid ABC transporter permease [Clostridiaceae bacterium]
MIMLTGLTALPTSFGGWIGFIIAKYGNLFLIGAGNTLLIALTGTLAGFIIGLGVAIIRTIPLKREGFTVRKILLKIVQFLLVAYIEIFRGTPMIVQAMVIYYGSMSLLGIDLAPITAGILIVSVNTGAYMSEIIRGGIESIDRGQAEAAQSIGMNHWQTMTQVILPQAVRNILPATGNEFIVNIKDTSVLNVIAVTELYYLSNSAAGTYFKFFEVFTVASVIYFIMTFSVTRVLRFIERKLDGPANYTIIGSQTTPMAIIRVRHGESLNNSTKGRS